MDKIYITADELLSSSLKLGEQIIRDGFRPDFIVGVWRGGTIEYGHLGGVCDSDDR